MNDWLLDTNIPSELVRPRPNAAVARWFDEQWSSSLHISVITLGELQKGISLAPNEQQKFGLSGWYSDELLLNFRDRILPVTQPIAEVWGGLMAWSKASGRALGEADGLIAATAIVHNLTVVTRNIKDFAPTGVKVLNPWEL